MSAERTQCGLTSLLPMSCRGRAEAFARRLQTRLRSLGADTTGAWPLAGSHSSTNGTHTQSATELFYDFQLECESPSSPTEEADERLAFFDPEPAERLDRLDTRVRRADSQERILRNGCIDFTGAQASTDSSLQSQPPPRENGLYSAITFDDCHRRSIDSLDSVNGTDEVDCAPKCEIEHSTIVNSGTDSDFESAKSELSEDADDMTDDAASRDDDFQSTPALDELSQETVQQKEVEATNDIAAEVVGDALEVTRSRSSSPEVITLSSFHAEAECETDDKPQRVRRCSSLKTGKTPPGTPGRKKIVRFADVLGLDLADVKTFMDEIPVVPKSAYEDLLNADFVALSPPNPGAATTLRPNQKCLTPLFQQPAAVTNLNDVLTLRYVCLESATVVEGAALAIGGSVRVRNLDFHKSVHVRYTMDGWRTYSDLQASYVAGSCDGFSDRFQFLLYTPAIRVGQKLEFAVRFQCKGCQYWDNNSGANYCYQCLEGTAGPALDDWQSSFY